MPLTDKDLDFLEIARDYSDQLNADVPTRVDPASVSTTAIIPFRALAIRTVLRARVAELSSVAIDLLESEKVVSAFTIIRSIVESTAIVFSIYKRIEKAIEEGKVGDSGEYFSQLGWGSRDSTTDIEAINILTLINKVDKIYSGFRERYDTLCEFTHPNWSGVLGAYSKFDDENVWLDIGEKTREVPYSLGIAPLIQGLDLFIKYYDEFAALIQDFARLCEDELGAQE